MLHIVVALPSEARPITNRLRLQRDASVAPFPLFRDADDRTRLIVGGLGKTAAAAAVGWLAASTQDDDAPAAWLNLGIAGGRGGRTGEAFLAHAVRDRASGRNWYPPLVVDPGGRTADVVTVDAPELDYADDALYEMEASGFVAAACRFAPAELVHCLKIISDGPDDALEGITAERIHDWIDGQASRIDALIEALRTLRDEHAAVHAAPPELEQLLHDHRFTVSESVQLRRLLQRRRALAPGSDLPELTSARRGKDVLKILRAEIDALSWRPASGDSQA